MTEEEARKVLRIAETADAGCPVCVHNLLDQLEESFPEFPWEKWHLQTEDSCCHGA